MMRRNSFSNRTLAGIFLISSATLCLEISLTRYFSISQEYHFAFLVVSIAFLGYGASGSFLALFKNIASYDLDKFLSSSSLLFSLTIPFSFFISNAIPFDFIKISWDKNQIFFIFLYYVLLSLPFFFAGLTISFAIIKASKLVNKIYFSDLLGAGTGTLIAAFVFLPKGDRGVIIFISFLALLSSFLFSIRRSISFKILLVCLSVIEGALFFSSPSWLSFRISPFKALPLAMKYPGANHHFTKWNAISRIDVLESPAVRYAPGLSLMYRKNLPPQLGLSIDGGELTAVTFFKNPEEPTLDFLKFLPSSLAYSFVKRPRTLVIEPKGGLDVLMAVASNASEIKVIESNPLIVKTLRNELRSSSGSLYHKENIQFALSHNRAALKQEKNTYELIVFSLTDVFGASGTGMYGFGEDYLYTVDSFIDVLNRLSPAGLVSMTMYLLPPPRQELRLLATWIEALEKSKINPLSCLIAIRSWGTISYFIKKSPFSEEDIQRLKDSAEERLFDLVYYPGIKIEEANVHNQFDEPLYYNYTLELLSPVKRQELYRNHLFQIQPATDNRPFFFNFFKLDRIKATYKSLGQKWLPLLQGEFLIILLLIQAFIIAFAMILLPLIVFRKRHKRRKGVFLKVFLYFSLIGMAFMFVEITLIQKFILFLEHPLYSISITIFSLLLSCGVGSYFSKKTLGQNLEKNLKASLLLCASLIVLYVFLLPLLHSWLIGLALPFKIVLTFFVIFPLGFLMGFPFPTGIRLLESQQKTLIPWAWATNAFSSVINSISALMIAFWGGYNLVLILAAGGYLSVLLFLGFANHGNKTNT